MAAATKAPVQEAQDASEGRVVMMAAADWETVREEMRAEMAAQLQAGQGGELSSLREQVEALKNMVISLAAGKLLGAPPRPPELERVQDEEARVYAAWAAEPREPIFVPADRDDEKVQSEGKPLPFKIFRVNGVVLAVPKGEPVTVPASVAAMYRHEMNPWASSRTRPPRTWSEIEATMDRAK